MRTQNDWEVLNWLLWLTVGTLLSVLVINAINSNSLKTHLYIQPCQSLAKNNWPVLASSKLCLLPHGCLKMLQDAVGWAHLCLEKDGNGFLISYYSFLQLQWHLKHISVWKQVMLLCCLQVQQEMGTQPYSKIQCSAVNFILQEKTRMKSGGTFGSPKGLPSPAPCLPSLLPAFCHGTPSLHLPQSNNIQLCHSLSTEHSRLWQGTDPSYGSWLIGPYVKHKSNRIMYYCNEESHYSLKLQWGSMP